MGNLPIGTKLMKRLRVTLLCLADGSSRLDVRATIKCLWYLTQIEGAPRPKLEVFSSIMAVAVLLLSLNLCLIVKLIMLSQIINLLCCRGLIG